MTSTMTTASGSFPPSRRVRAGAVVLLVRTAGLAFLVVNISYGLALEYGDTAASDARIAETLPSGAQVVTLAVDSGLRYLSTAPHGRAAHLVSGH